MFLRKYKLGMTQDLELIDGDKWYKDEGGKTNFLEFRMGVHNNKDQYIQCSHDIKFETELVYANDKTTVLNQGILKIDPDQYHILTTKDGQIDVRFKIEQVSSHHQRRRFSLKVTPINDPTIGPCFTKPILVLSKRNKPKKPLKEMSPQKRKEVTTKRKQQQKRKRKQAMSLLAEEDEAGYIDDNDDYGSPSKRRKLNESQNESDLTDSNDDHLYDSNEDEEFINLRNGQKAENEEEEEEEDENEEEEDDDELCQRLMMKQCQIKPEHYPSLQKYREDPQKYFDFGPIQFGKKKKEKAKEKKDGDGDGKDDSSSESDNENADRNYLIAKKLKKNVVACLKLAQDVFSSLSARPMYYPMFGMGDQYTAKMVYFCSFCNRFSNESPDAITHYEHCKVCMIYMFFCTISYQHIL